MALLVVVARVVLELAWKLAVLIIVVLAALWLLGAVTLDLNAREEVADDVVANAGQHRLGVELDGLDGVVAVSDAHH